MAWLYSNYINPLLKWLHSRLVLSEAGKPGTNSWLEDYGCTEAGIVFSTSDIKLKNKISMPYYGKPVITLKRQRSVRLARFPSLSSGIVACFKVRYGH